MGEHKPRSSQIFSTAYLEKIYLSPVPAPLLAFCSILQYLGCLISPDPAESVSQQLNLAPKKMLVVVCS